MTTKKLRTERTLAIANVTMGPGDIALLASLAHDPRYEALLDVMERACILQETELINTPEEQESVVLAKHKHAKAFWQIFIYVQRQVKLAESELTRRGEEVEDEAPTEEDLIQGVND